MSSACVTCAVYRPDAQPRPPWLPPVCDGDRRLLDTHLGELPRLHDRLAEPEPVEVDDRWYPLAAEAGRLARVDPLAAVGGAGPVPGQSGKPRVSGSRERPAPLPLDRIDLTAPARPASRRLMVRATLGLVDDQTGHLSVATELDAWVRDWRETLWPDHHQPVPTVSELAGWLRNRLVTAIAQHPAIDEFAAEIRDLRNTLRGQLGETDPQPETMRFKGVTCRSCDLRGFLMRRPGDEYIECGHCGLLYTEAEYADWRDRLAGYERAIRGPEKVAELLRRSVASS